MTRFRLLLPLACTALALCIPAFCAAAGLTFSCGEDSDIYQLVKATGHETSRFDTPSEAIAKAPEGSGVLVLAGDYPQTPTPITEADYRLAAEKKLRLYVEFPETVPGIEMGSPQLTAIGPYGSVLERIVVTGDFFGAALEPMRIMAFYDCYFRPVTSDRGKIETHLVAARVVGHDTAVLGLPETTWPILFCLENGFCGNSYTETWPAIPRSRGFRSPLVGMSGIPAPKLRAIVTPMQGNECVFFSRKNSRLSKPSHNCSQ